MVDVNEFVEELKNGNLITWFVVFMVIFIICEILQTVAVLFG